MFDVIKQKGEQKIPLEKNNIDWRVIFIIVV